MIAALVLIGAPGSGKSALLEALMTLCELDGVEYGGIESEQLSLGWPPLSAAQWTPQLDAVLALQRGAGRRRFLVVATVENAAELGDVVGATRADVSLVVCLCASPDAVAARIGDREPDRWPGKAPLIAHARELAKIVPEFDAIDLRIDTEDRRPEDVAGEVYEAMRSRGLIDVGRR